MCGLYDDHAFYAAFLAGNDREMHPDLEMVSRHDAARGETPVGDPEPSREPFRFWRDWLLAAR